MLRCRQRFPDRVRNKRPAKTFRKLAFLPGWTAEASSRTIEASTSTRCSVAEL